MSRLKKLLLMAGFLFTLVTASNAGQYYWVGLDGIVHSSGLTTATGLPSLDISTDTVITKDLRVDGIITGFGVVFSSITVSELITTNNLTSTGTITFPNDSIDGSDIKNNEITSEELAQDVEVDTMSVNNLATILNADIDTLTVSNLTTTNNIVVTGIINFPSNSVEGQDIKDNEITSEELADNIVVTSITVNNLATIDSAVIQTLTVNSLATITVLNTSTTTVSNLLTTENLTVNAVISFPNDSVDGADIKNNEITSEELAQDVEFTTTTVTRTKVDYLVPRNNVVITLESDLDMDNTYRLVNSPDLFDIASDTNTLKSELDTETATRISEDNLLDNATNQLTVDLNNEIATRISEDNLLDNSTNQLQINITVEETARINQDNLIGYATGQLSADVESSTNSLRVDLNTEIADRISEDNLLDNSTNQLQVNIAAEETSRINEDLSIRSDFNTSTNTLQGNIDSEETTRINEDILIRADFNSSTNTLQGNIDTEESSRISYDSLLNDSTNQLKTDLITEINTRISEDNLLDNATNQLQVNITSEETARINEDLSIRADFNTSTNTIQSNIDTEISNRISEDNLLDNATNQLQINITAEETLRINQDILIGASTGQMRSDFNSSTNTLQVNIDTEETSRINQDNLIGAATGQIRTDFEAYDSLLNGSTISIKADLITETNTRISEDNLLDNATDQLQLNITSEESARIAYDSLLNNSTQQLQVDVNTKVLRSGDTMTGDLTVPNLFATYVTGTFIGTASSATYALNSDLLDSFDSTYFAIKTDVVSSTNTLQGAIDLNTTHRSSDGSDHTFINQNITTTATPTFADLTLTYGVNASTGVFNTILWNNYIMGYDTGSSQLRISTGTIISDDGARQLYIDSSNDFHAVQAVASGGDFVLTVDQSGVESHAQSQQFELYDVDSIDALDNYIFDFNNGTLGVAFEDNGASIKKYSTFFDQGGLIRVSSNIASAGIYATDYGDLYIDDILEVGGVSNFLNTVYFRFGGLHATFNNIQFNLKNDFETIYGNNDNFFAGYSSIDDQFRVGVFNDVSTDANVAFIVTDSTWIAIGSTNTATYMNGQGDLFIADELEVGGISRLKNTYLSGNLFITTSSDYIQMYDDKEIKFGTGGADFAIGYSNIDNEYRIVRGNNIATDANTAFRVTASTIVAIGDAGTMSYMDGKGDLYVQDEIEVSGVARFKNSMRIYGNQGFTLEDNSEIRFGNGADFSMGYSSIDNEYRIVRGNDPSIDANVAFRITASTVVAIGDMGTLNYATNSGDLYIENILEVDGNIEVTGQTNFGNIATMNGAYLNMASAPLFFESGKTEAQLKLFSPPAANMVYMDTTNKALVLSTGTAVGSFGLIYDGNTLPVGW